MPTITSGRDASTARAASAITSNVGSPTGLACTCMPAVARATAGMPATGSSTTTSDPAAGDDDAELGHHSVAEADTNRQRGLKTRNHGGIL